MIKPCDVVNYVSKTNVQSVFEPNVCNTSNNYSVADVNSWHKRLGYTSKETPGWIFKPAKCTDHLNKLDFCSNRVIDKMHKFHFHLLKHTTSPFERICSELWIP